MFFRNEFDEKKGKALYVLDKPLIMFTGKLRPFNPYVISGSFSTQAVIDEINIYLKATSIDIN
jgi:hypothetical protein